jgi:hypothetical protein
LSSKSAKGTVRSLPEEASLLDNVFLINIYREPHVVKNRDAPDTVFAGYPSNPKAGYWISGKGWIPDIRPDTWLENYIFGKISNKFIKTKHDIETKLFLYKFLSCQI